MAAKVILETQRLRLREFEAGDGAFFLQLANSPGWLRHIGDRNLHDAEAARAYLAAGPIASYARHGFGLWAVELLENDQPIGSCGILRRAGLDIPDLGFALLPQYEGKGYAREAGLAACLHAHSELGLPTLAAITNPDNDASISLLRAIGFREAGIVVLPGIEQPQAHFLRDASRGIG